MAFNFSWSPLTADEEFYAKARDLLTKALNKSPKPPIIVDDILVSELNLGTVPPDLEILEIGDLAEDRFRGIFKMCYSGDAFLTLKTRVQVRLWLRICALFHLVLCFALHHNITIPVGERCDRFFPVSAEPTLTTTKLQPAVLQRVSHLYMIILGV